jgi:hypothetical protein
MDDGTKPAPGNTMIKDKKPSSTVALKSPKHKLIAFFSKSRDAWKAKHQSLKKHFKIQENKMAAMAKSRAMWRERAKKAEKEAASTHTENERLRAALDDKKKI